MSRLAPAGARGTVMGIYNTFEFSGIFLGGLSAGIVYSFLGSHGVYGLSVCILGLWAVIILLMHPLRLLNSLTVSLTVGIKESEILNQLQSIPGIEDITLFPDEGLGYIKTDPKVFEKQTIESVPGVQLL